MSELCQARIDLAALTHNVNRVKQLAPNSRILAMIKGNAYGHGLVTIAKHLQRADGFGLARFQEAIQLREAGITQRLVVLEGFTREDQLAMIDAHRLDLVIHDMSQVEHACRYPWQTPVNIWLKVDTGMHRLGLLPSDAAQAWQQLVNAPKVNVQVCMSHFAQAQWQDDPKTLEQMHTFNELCTSWSTEKSLANSAAVMAWSDSHADWVRPGLMLYGVSPFEHTTGLTERLLPVMTLTSKVIAKRFLKKGDTIGYDSIYTCPEDMPVVVAAIGYADGYPRYITPGTPVLVNGVKTRIVGRVSMDMVSIDCRDIDVAINDEVVLWGKGLPIEVIARHANTSPYELLSGITGRVEYITL